MHRTLILASLFTASLSAADVNSFSWMSGCWAVQQGSVLIEEQWNLPVDGQMMGISRTIRASKVVFSEFMRIESDKGEVYFVPRIGTGQAPGRFKLTKQTDSEVTFEDPTHDFPQRILYRKTANGLAARVDGIEKGKARAEDFPMKSVPCK